jgi:hypothetical protein
MLIEKEETVDVDAEKSDVANDTIEKITGILNHQRLNQKLQLTLAREKLESKLLLCRIELKTCNLNGVGPEETLKLLEQELEIKSKLKGLKDTVLQMIEPSTSENNHWKCNRKAGQSKTICVDEDLIESTRPVIKDRKSP